MSKIPDYIITAINRINNFPTDQINGLSEFEGEETAEGKGGAGGEADVGDRFAVAWN